MSDLVPLWDTTARLGAAILLAAPIGWEREASRRAAGLRTHILVALGSAGFTVIGLELTADGRPGADPSRVIQAVATGIGFLGAGAIIHAGGHVRGLTTSAGIWVVAALGIAAGAGFWAIAALLAAFTFGTLTILRAFERPDKDGPAP